MVRAVEAFLGSNLAGRQVAVLGAGAAARSIIYALGQAGVGQIVVVNRSSVSAEKAAALASIAEVGAPQDIQEAELIINATSVGMAGGPAEAEIPLNEDLLKPDQSVIDIVYNPIDTALLEAARAKGCAALDGRAMLLHQAALSIEAWTKNVAPLDVLQNSLDRSD